MLISISPHSKPVCTSIKGVKKLNMNFFHARNKCQNKMTKNKFGSITTKERLRSTEKLWQGHANKRRFTAFTGRQTLTDLDEIIFLNLKKERPGKKLKIKSNQIESKKPHHTPHHKNETQSCMERHQPVRNHQK